MSSLESNFFSSQSYVEGKDKDEGCCGPEFKMRLAFCAERANWADFLADGGKVLEDNG